MALILGAMLLVFVLVLLAILQHQMSQIRKAREEAPGRAAARSAGSAASRPWPARGDELGMGHESRASLPASGREAATGDETSREGGTAATDGSEPATGEAATPAEKRRKERHRRNLDSIPDGAIW